MTLTSFSNPHLDGAGTSMESDSRSASTSSTDFHSLGLPLSENSEIFLQNGETLMNLRDGGNANDTPKAYVIGSNNVTIGTEFKLKIQGDTQFSITNVYEGGRVEHQRSIEDAQQKDALCPGRDNPERIRKNTHKKTLTCNDPRMYQIFIVLLGILLLLLVIIIPSNKQEHTVEEPLVVGDEAFMVPRHVWGGVTPENPPAQVPPAILAIIKHTGGSQCLTHKDCRERTREIQKEHMNTQRLPDIGYNFLIGGDEMIYVGRGYGVENSQRHDSIDIAFIGNYTENTPTNQMLSLAERILILGTRKSGLDYYRYFVVSHNQTERTDSPGEQLFRAVTKFTHYHEGICFGEHDGYIIDYECP